MKTLRVRRGFSVTSPEWVRLSCVARAGHLAVTRDRRGHDVVHVPTRMTLLPCLNGLSLKEARRALTILSALQGWGEFRAPAFAFDLPHPVAVSIRCALEAVAEMVRS
jgi:hypothetical protein